MARLYLVRHAEPAALWGAHPDPGLSELGHDQASRVAKHLASLGAKYILTSPLARCQETAAPTVLALGMAATLTRAVAEIPVPADVTDHRSWLTRVMNSKWSDNYISEGLRNWRDGIAQALLAQKEDTIIFSHFVAINAAVGLASAQDDVIVFKPGHASITILETQSDQLRLIQHGNESATQLA
jgi:broad specificity phosphatase PhoE